MRKDKVKPKKVQLAEQSKAALSESKLAKMWAEQVTTKTVETNSRGLKRKLFNLEGSVRKAGRVDMICVCTCVCPADRVGGKVNNMIIAKKTNNNIRSLKVEPWNVPPMWTVLQARNKWTPWRQGEGGVMITLMQRCPAKLRQSR